MGVNLVVAVTDDDWFEMLRRHPNLSEVNFWAPSAASFRALQPGEMFLFKLHAPRNVIVGGGIFAYANVLPCSLAWTAFGEANGAQSAQEMRLRIARYRRADPSDRSDFEIGCRILTQPFFFEEAEWISVPPSWSPNIVSFKTYRTTDGEGLALWKSAKSGGLETNGPRERISCRDGLTAVRSFSREARGYWQFQRAKTWRRMLVAEGLAEGEELASNILQKPENFQTDSQLTSETIFGSFPRRTTLDSRARRRR